MFGKESIKIKKDTFDGMNKVIEESKKISEMKPKLDNTYKAMKEQISTYSKVQQENYDDLTDIATTSAEITKECRKNRPEIHRLQRKKSPAAGDHP